MKFNTILVCFSLVLGTTGCSTVDFTPGMNQPTRAGVKVLYEYPQGEKYNSLGTVDAYVYQPGWRAPTVADVMPKLTEKAAAAGGNALIVRSQQVGQFDRSINVTAEVLYVEYSDERTP